ncbi:MAG: HNH endonuclease [Firmicutes bacterium]|nr:HNH endonuclease [Bacillota bacterium]
MKKLEDINQDFPDLLRKPIAFSKTFQTSVTSKAKFDKFDFDDYANECITLEKHNFEKVFLDLGERKTNYNAYLAKYEKLISTELGKAGSEKIAQDRFNKVEQQLFKKRKLREQLNRVHIFFIVTYTSPKGRNHYKKKAVWNDVKLAQGFSEAIKRAEKRSSEEFQRSLERNKMTSALRYKIIKRDGKRCRHCGRSPQDGITLHVDHIVPISKGGKTVENNLQTLCADCNLGKSDRY